MKTRLLKCEGVVLDRAEHLHSEVLEYAENCPSELHAPDWDRDRTGPSPIGCCSALFEGGYRDLIR